MSGLIDSIFGGGDDKGSPAPAPSASAADLTPEVKPKPDTGPSNPDIDSRASEFEIREQTLGQRAAAAGAQRSDNDADLLGYSPPKRRAASRTLVG